jgi:hypothetical protein
MVASGRGVSDDGTSVGVSGMEVSVGKLGVLVLFGDGGGSAATERDFADVSILFYFIP